jgi:small-conductance mechanosensitive channel
MSPIEIILDQLLALLIVLERPLVQIQLGALLGVILLGIGLERLLRRRLSMSEPWRGLVAPVASLGLAVLAALVLQLLDFRNGLIWGATALLWAWLGYRIVVLIASHWMGQESQVTYLRWVFRPIFLLTIGFFLLRSVVDLNAIGRIEIVQLLETAVTVFTLSRTAFIFYLFLVLAWVARDGLQRILRKRTSDQGTINAVTTLSRYAIVTMGFLIALRTLGFDLSSIAIIGGALSVGIGFGLQQIVANFISGIVLLFEQSLRPGDVIQIDGQFGVVEKLNIRSTQMRTYDNVEVIVPNEDLLTSRLTTYTRSDRLMRIAVPVGVSYSSDPARVRDILVEAVGKHGLVRKSPEPSVQFMAFGDSSLDFRVLAWIDDPLRVSVIRSDLHFIIWNALKDAGVEIPFPQRDLHLRSASDGVWPSRDA